MSKPTMSTKTQTTFKDRLHTFAKHTTFNGYRELLESKRWPQQCFWVVIMLSCTGMLIFGVSIQVRQWVNAETVTKASRLPKGKYDFPVILLGLGGWSWMDSVKLEQLGISYEELQVAKGYTSKGLEYNSEKPFDEVKSKLWEKIRRLGFSGLFELFSELAWEDFDGMKKHDLVNRKNWDGEAVIYELNTTSATKSGIAKTWTYRFNFNFSAYLEIVKRISSWFPKSGESTAKAVMVLNPDTNQIVQLQPGYRHTISVDCRIYRQLHECRGDMDHNPLYYISTCLLDCEIQANISHKTTSCVDYPQYYNIKPGIQLTESFSNGSLILCHQGILVNGSHIEGQENTIYTSFSDSDNQQRLADIAECQKQCLPECEQWATVWGVLSSPQIMADANENISQVEINFPDTETMIITEEVEQYAWHDMISDVGGLLGLWLGGSIMSIFQIVHLCCWAERKKKKGAVGNEVIMKDGKGQFSEMN